MGKAQPQVIPVGVLTYRRSDTLVRTLDSFKEFNRDYMNRFRFFIFVQDYTDDDTRNVINIFYSDLFEEIILSKVNIGAAWGMVHILDRAAKRCPDSKYLMTLEDDWESRDSLGRYLDDILEFLESDQSVGYIRLRATHQRVFNKNRMTKEKVRYIPVNDLIFKGNMHFTTNPVIFRRELLQHFQDYNLSKEIHMIEVCHYLEECGAQLNKDCFWHIGLSQRTRPWRG